jgi:hypothetical protein
MMLSFSRARISKAVDGLSAPSRLLAIAWEDASPSIDGKPLERVFDETYRFEEPTFGPIIVSRSPWWSDLPTPLGEEGLWLSYQGYFNGIWCDGVFGRWVDGHWVDLILPGPAFRWNISRSLLPIEDVAAFWSEEKFFAQKQSLVLAVRRAFDNDLRMPLFLQSHECPVHFVLHMLLFRLAFPDRTIQILPSDAAWKRLAQNLNISPLKVHPANPPMVGPQLGPREKLLELIQWQQSKSPFIPQNLLSSLSR